MAAVLRAEGARVQDAIYPGGHNWNLWSTHVDQMLILAGYDFEHQLPSPHAGGYHVRRPDRQRHHH